MKLAFLTPLSVLSIAVTASAVTLDVPAAPPNSVVEPAPTLGAGAIGADVDRELATLERNEGDLRQQLDLLSRESELLRARTLARGRAYARLARAGLLPIGGGFDAFVEHAARLERLHRSLARDLALERQTFERRTALSKQLAGITARRGPLLAQQSALSQAQTALLAARDRDQAFERAFRGSAIDDHTAVYGAPPSALPAASGFASVKGNLPFPLAGRSELRSTRRAGASGPGLTMRAPAGSVVRAVYPGRVAFADSYADYGRTVILDHGGGYYTVSANLGEIEVKVGDDVKGGARIATLSSGSTGSMLYFEVRIGQETADPAEWFGI